MNGNYHLFDDFKSEAEFRGFVKAKLLEYDKIIPVVNKLIEKTWTLWGMIIGVSWVTSLATSFIFWSINKGG